MYFLSAGAGKTVSGLTPAAPIAALQSVCLFLRRLDLLDLDLTQIQRIQTRIHGIGGLDKLSVGCAGGQGVRREAVPCLGLLFQVLHSQRHHERLALGIAQTDDHKRGGHDD